MDKLREEELVKQLGSILKTNVRACKAVGHPFVVQVLFKNILLLYNLLFLCVTLASSEASLTKLKSLLGYRIHL